MRKTDTILLPIHPKYSQLILSRHKTIEVRRGNIPSHIKKVVIYETAPTKKIVGWFEVSQIESECKHCVYETFTESMKIKEDEFFDYLKDKQNAQLIFIKNPVKFKTPFALEKRAPQAFEYLQDYSLEEAIYHGGEVK